jgi:2-dehydro-3-deoxyphosphogluconate aldolase / (4S)-4-hydroxy-2-oxoglutarate aldolase
MTFTKQQIIDEMTRSRLVPLFTHDDPLEALDVVTAAYEGGISVFEFTNRKPNSFEVFSFLVKHRNQFPQLALGIGTVMDPVTTEKYINAGADFIISPVLKPSMAPVCHQHNRLWIPGCATLTEIVTAKEHGAEVIKIFPGSVLGPGFISAIMPVVPDLKLMITGGVEPTKENITGWLSVGAFCVGMGSQLFTKEILKQKDWDGLRERIRSLLQITKDFSKR